MANTSSGYVSIKSTDKELLEDLKNKIKDGPFSYGGPADVMDMDDGVDVGFTGKWSCEGAWVFFEDLMSNADYAFQQALIDSEISGSESEEGAREACETSKRSGEATITRRDVSDEREWEDDDFDIDEDLVAETQDPFITDKADAFRAIDEDVSDYALDRLSDELKADRTLIMAAVSKRGALLMHASGQLKADKELVVAAVNNNGHALEYASDELQADKEVVLAAAKSDDPFDHSYMILEFASDELKADKDVIMALLENKDFQFKKNLAAALGMSAKELKERFSS